MKINIAILSISLLLSCKSSKPSTESTVVSAPQNPPKEAVVMSTDAQETVVQEDSSQMQPSKAFVYRFIISFISIGEGTDRNAKQIFDTFLSEWKTRYGKEIHYQPFHWGREGEIDFCFPLVELNDKQQIQFIKECKTKYTGHYLVQFAENEPCRHRR